MKSPTLMSSPYPTNPKTIYKSQEEEDNPSIQLLVRQKERYSFNSTKK